MLGIPLCCLTDALVHNSPQHTVLICLLNGGGATFCDLTRSSSHPPAI